MLRTVFSSLVYLLFLNCIALTGRLVYYAELQGEPYLELDSRQNLILHLQNSKKHSALHIQSIDYKIDKVHKKVFISAHQALAIGPRPLQFKITLPLNEIM